MLKNIFKYFKWEEKGLPQRAQRELETIDRQLHKDIRVAGPVNTLGVRDKIIHFHP